MYALLLRWRAYLETEILIVDEVLAVGDAAFQKKCLGKMGEVANQGRTVLFVSHNMGVLTKLCNRSMWISEGKIVYAGSAKAVANRYQSENATTCAEWIRSLEQKRCADVSFEHVKVMNSKKASTPTFDSNDSICVEILYTVNRPLAECQIGTRVMNSDGVVVFYTADTDSFQTCALPRETGSYKTSFVISGGFLAPGRYTLFIAAHMPRRAVYEAIEQTVVFDVSALESLVAMDGRLGLVTPLISWDTQIDRP